MSGIASTPIDHHAFWNPVGVLHGIRWGTTLRAMTASLASVDLTLSARAIVRSCAVSGRAWARSGTCTAVQRSGNAVSKAVGHNLGTGRDQAASTGHGMRLDLMVRSIPDSWSAFPMVIAAAAEIGAGHGTQWSFRSRWKSCWARPGHEMGTGWAQSKTPTLRSAFVYSKLLFLFGNFGCEGRI